jgi:ABC-2 type transport system ATP-binding protein
VTQNAVEIRHVSKTFKIYKELNQSLKSAIMRHRRAIAVDFQALSDVTLNIPEGSTFALVGDNGSGKSTLLKCIAKILVPDDGTIKRHGRMAAMLEVGSGFHPELSGRDNIYLNGSILGMGKREIDSKLDSIVAFSGVEEFIDQPVKNYSSGMYVRLGFSVAIHTEPDILLVDEILAVGDAAFQEKCAMKFAEFRRDGRTVVVVSHSIPQLRAMADQAAWLQGGRVQKVGAARAVLEEYADSTRSGVRIDAEGKVRWGTGEALVDSLTVLNHRSETVTGPVHTGDELILRMAFHADQRIENPVFALALEALDGTHLWSSNTRDLGFSIDSIAGAGLIEFKIPKLNLQKGEYLFHASIMNSTTEHVFDYLREAAAISVSSEHVTESDGYVVLGGRWSIPTGIPGELSGH